MKQPKIVNSKGEKIDMDLIFSFTCKENGKNYVAINNNDEMARLAKENSRYISYYYRMHVFNSGSQQSNAINLHSNNSKFIILNQSS